MSKLEERALIYIAMMIFCSVAGVFMGLAAGVWTFIQMAAVIEILYSLGNSNNSSSVHRQSGQQH